MKHPKSFYYNYQASDEMFPVDDLTNEEIINQQPTSVLDFGCGTGKNLKYLQSQG
jgi:trans-aconitate methyltransferase